MPSSHLSQRQAAAPTRVDSKDSGSIGFKEAERMRAATAPAESEACASVVRDGRATEGRRCPCDIFSRYVAKECCKVLKETKTVGAIIREDEEAVMEPLMMSWSPLENMQE